VFFDRSGGPQARQSELPTPLSLTQSEPDAARIKRRRLAALGLAAAMAVPAALAQVSHLYAADARPPKAPAGPGAGELLKVGLTQFDHRQYEEAEETLRKIDTRKLSDQERRSLIQKMALIGQAAAQRRTARMEYESGIDDTKSGRNIEARSHFEAVVDNEYAAPELMRRSKAALGLVVGPLPESAVAAAANDPAPPVSAPPAGGVGSSDFSAPPGAPATLPADSGAGALGSASPTTQPANQPMAGKDYYTRAVQEYRDANWDAARRDFKSALAAGYTQKPDNFHDSAQTYLNRMDARARADRVATGANANGAAAVAAASPVGPQSNDPAADAALNATARVQDLERRQAQSQATDLVRQARDAQHANNLDQARTLYAKAAHLDPSNSQAQTGLDEVLSLQGRNPNGPNPMDQFKAGIEIRVREITYQFNTAINEAREAIRAHEWDRADAAIQRAELASGSDRAIFSPAALREFDTTIISTRLARDREREQVTLHARALNDTKAANQIAQDRLRELNQRKSTIADLKNTAQNLTKEARYREALGVIDQILVLDPVDEYAVGVRPWVEDKWQFQEQRNNREMRTRLYTNQLNRADSYLIPYDDVLRYPTDWPDISATRDQTVQQERGENRENVAVQNLLDRQLPDVHFDGSSFTDVIDFLRDVSGANIFVNWKSLEAAGIDRNAPISTNLRNVKFSKALGVILDSVGGGTIKVGYTIDDGVISISTGDDLSKSTVTKVYDIRDMILNVPDFTDAPDFSLNSTSNNQNQNPQGGGGIGSTQVTQANDLFGGSGTQGGQREKPGPTKQEMVDQITKLISETVAPESWREAGGTTGALRELQGQLIVTQTPENQQQLSNLLEKLREARAIQVTVETRFLSVQRNFLEDVGVDLNMIFNLNGSLSKNISPIPVSSTGDTFTQAPTTAVPGSIGSTATSLTTSATYLDDFQVGLILRATQASQTSMIVQAPRVTLFNGQRAYVLVSTQLAYVSNLSAQVGTGVAAFSPQISVVDSGVLLDVTATVSADRKYVTLTLRPQLATLLDLKSFNFQSPTSGTGIGGLGGLGGIGGVGGSPGGTIQEPEIQITEVKTTVSVPDGGTLLLGGQTIAGEIEKEAGVPILSKVPFLKRLFTNRSMAKDEQILLILVKPTIIIEKEIEQKQFPLLTSKLGA